MANLMTRHQVDEKKILSVDKRDYHMLILCDLEIAGLQGKNIVN